MIQLGRYSHNKKVPVKQQANKQPWPFFRKQEGAHCQYPQGLTGPVNKQMLRQGGGSASS